MDTSDLEPRTRIAFDTLLHLFETEEVQVPHRRVCEEGMDFLTRRSGLRLRVPSRLDAVDEDVAAGGSHS